MERCLVAVDVRMEEAVKAAAAAPQEPGERRTIRPRATGAERRRILGVRGVGTLECYEARTHRNRTS